MRELTLASAFAWLALVAASAWAQEARKQDVADTATVSRVDSATDTFWVENDQTAREAEYRVDERTRILVGSKHLRLEDLKPGDRVVVSGTHEGATPTETPVADVVTVVIEPPHGTAPREEPEAAEPAGDVR